MFSLPVLIICFITQNPQVIVTYTGGICGTFIVLIVPVMIVLFARRHERRQAAQEGKKKEENFNASPFQSMAWVVTIVVFSVITLYFVIVGIIKGNAG